MPWLARYPVISSALTSILRGVTNEERFNDLLEQAGNARGLDFVDRMLDLLGTRVSVDSGFTEEVPSSGALLVVANHPLGMQDALGLLQWLGSIRPDIRMLGNDWLASVPALADLLLPVDVFGRGAGSRARHLYRALENGEALIVFPAGEVSRLRGGGVCDGTWSDGFARLAFRSGTPVLPVHVRAKNSAIFYAVSMLSKPLSTALLPREATARSGRHIALSIGKMVSADDLMKRSGGSSGHAAEIMRDDVYRVGSQHELAPAIDLPLAPPGRVDDIVSELERCEKLSDLNDGKQLFLFTGNRESSLMREIGRLRELTFRKVGEGSGKSCDLDTYDTHYEHLVLWDAKEKCVAGSYRLGHAGRLTSARDMAGLYTTTLFEFSASLQSRIRLGLELGRSFVAPAYWRTRALEQLWQGIGLYLQKHPELKYLFGAVSMPITLPQEAREWIAAAHLQVFGMPDLATARRPFNISPDIVRLVEQACEGLDSPAAMGRLKQHLDTLGVTLPMLYRQYVDLVEPGGAQFLAFGDDPGFSGCIDGLVWIDLAMLKPGKRARYLGQRPRAMPVDLSERGVAHVEPSQYGDGAGKSSEVAADVRIAS
ncbi:MAG: lysophospholipid acyltransferase family protein [Dokdonella sp.]